MAARKKLIHDHAATVYEDLWRTRIPGAQRYWERDLEFDLVAADPDGGKGLLVAEVKWRRLTRAQHAEVRHELEAKWATCSLATRHPRVRFDVIDAGRLAE
jgi:hypothetical protein